ncbi:hypothetical protein [Haloarcula litorea]|uniref:hypothetical protein n=1 Tax=Haloarcula litorea TaxID=3032579 RepID=UPI0023E786ED|nr:hypothetical protein [Halomicroarcula sp. GDY20]
MGTFEELVVLDATVGLAIGAATAACAVVSVGLATLLGPPLWLPFGVGGVVGLGVLWGLARTVSG